MKLAAYNFVIDKLSRSKYKILEMSNLDQAELKRKKEVCAHRYRCISSTANNRYIYRWIHEDILERVQQTPVGSYRKNPAATAFR